MKDLKQYIDFGSILTDTYESQKEYMKECIENKENIIHLNDDSEENLIKTQELFKNIIGTFEKGFSEIELTLDLCDVNFKENYIWVSYGEEKLMGESYETTGYNIGFKIDISNGEDLAHFVDYEYEGF